MAEVEGDVVEGQGGPSSPAGGLIARFAAELKRLRQEAGNPSFRAMATRAHVSRSALAQAVGGRVMPSLPVVLGFVRACGADQARWGDRWRRVRAGLDLVTSLPAPSGSPWPHEPLADGADPDAAGCAVDAIIAHSRRFAIADSRIVAGQVQLRYSPRMGAAWSRFEAFSPWDHMVANRFAEIEMQAVRLADNTVVSHRMEYQFDYHWSDLVLTGEGPVYGKVLLYLDGDLVATGETDRLFLP